MGISAALVMSASLLTGGAPEANQPPQQAPVGIEAKNWAGSYWATASQQDRAKLSPRIRIAETRMYRFWQRRSTIQDAYVFPQGGPQGIRIRRQWYQAWNFLKEPGNIPWPFAPPGQKSVYLSIGMRSPATNHLRPADPQKSGWASVGGAEFGGKTDRNCNTRTGSYGSTTHNPGNSSQIFTRTTNDFREYDADAEAYGLDQNVNPPVWRAPLRGSLRIIAELRHGTHQLVQAWLTRDHYCTFQKIP